MVVRGLTKSVYPERSVGPDKCRWTKPVQPHDVGDCTPLTALVSGPMRCRGRRPRWKGASDRNRRLVWPTSNGPRAAVGRSRPKRPGGPHDEIARSCGGGGGRERMRMGSMRGACAPQASQRVGSRSKGARSAETLTGTLGETVVPKYRRHAAKAETFPAGARRP